MSEPAIEVRDLCKNYGPVQAVDRISFAVQPGELVGFLGPNGAGKSTTMRVLTTIMPASSGTAKVFGLDVMDQSMEVRRRVGFLPESVPIYPEMRVEEYLQYRAKLKGVERLKRGARIDYCLEKCRIREVRRRLVGTLSKGYRQRVGLADAIVADPPLLILDEPTSGLDPVQIRETLNAIRELAGSHTVLLSTHILPEVEAICDRVIIINRGTLHWDGRLSELSGEVQRLAVEVRGPEAPIAAMLAALPGVTRVVRNAGREEGVHSYQCEVDGRFDAENTLVKRIVENGWGLRRLDPRRKGLEELYMDVVLRTDPTP